jgi:hypothetical protein
MRTTIDLPEPLLENAKQRAAERGVTLSVLVEDAVRTHLAVRPQESDPPFHLYTVRSQFLRPGAEMDRTSAFIVEDDESAFGGDRAG